MGAEDSVKLIMEAIEKDDDEFVRIDMLRALKTFKDPITRPLILNIIKNDNSWEARKMAIELLAWIADPQSVVTLVESLKTDRHLFVRQEAEKALQIIAQDYKIPWTSAEALLARKNEIID